MSDLIRLMVGPEQSDNNAQLGVLLQQVRDDRGYSRAKAANLFKLSSEYLRLIERGKRTPAASTTVDMLEAYTEPFNVTREEDTAVVIFRGHRVRFVSRIQETRHTQPQSLSRNEQLGYIVSVLAIADNKTIDTIYQKLKNPN